MTTVVSEMQLKGGGVEDNYASLVCQTAAEIAHLAAGVVEIRSQITYSATPVVHDLLYPWISQSYLLGQTGLDKIAVGFKAIDGG